MGPHRFSYRLLCGPLAVLLALALAAAALAVTKRGDGRANTLVGSAGDDRLDGNDVLLGGRQRPEREGADQFGDGISDGGPGNDIVLGGGASDRVSGGAGDDRLYGGARTDLYECGPGNDIAFVENAAEGFFAAAAGCEQVILGDPSVTDPAFDGLDGAPHAGKATGR